MNESSGVQIVIIVLTFCTLSIVRPYEKIDRYLRFDFYVTEYRVKKYQNKKLFWFFFSHLEIEYTCYVVYT